MNNQNQKQTEEQEISPNLQKYLELVAQRHELVQKAMKLEKQIFDTYSQALKDIEDFS